LFETWQAHRSADDDLHAYYRSPRFRLDFVRFMENKRDEYPGTLIEPIVVLERLMLRQCPKTADLASPIGPALAAEARIEYADWDLESAVFALGAWDPAPVRPLEKSRSYLIVPGRVASCYAISPLVAYFLPLCDGTRSADDLIEMLGSAYPALDETGRHTLYEALVGRYATLGVLQPVENPMRLAAAESSTG
jgi:hypothetical protein